MKAIEWYLLVIISTAMLIVSIVYSNIFYALVSFGIAMYIKKYNKSIQLAKVYRRYMKK